MDQGCKCLQGVAGVLAREGAGCRTLLEPVADLVGSNSGLSDTVFVGGVDTEKGATLEVEVADEIASFSSTNLLMHPR